MGSNSNRDVLQATQDAAEVLGGGSWFPEPGWLLVWELLGFLNTWTLGMAPLAFGWVILKIFGANGGPSLAAQSVTVLCIVSLVVSNLLLPEYLGLSWDVASLVSRIGD